MLPMQPGDVPQTFADVSDLLRDTGLKPEVPIAAGIAEFVAWYRGHYGV
jgi:UDP-glucuronate 4-epimerase